MYYSFVLLLTVTVTQVSCSVMLDDGDVGHCQESPWLCRQLALQNALISEQNRKMDQYHLEITQLKDLTHKQNDELSNLNAKVN
jgi:hypothetical protein